MTSEHDSLLSRTISFALRHRPEDLDLTLDKEGWCSVNDLLAGLLRHGHHVSRDKLDELVAQSDKQRFALSEDGRRIRANQGHSTAAVKLTFEKKHPPAILYHGTIAHALSPIFRKGLLPMKRHHVHLSADVASAVAVGARRGNAVVLQVRAGDMALAGQDFFLSENGVWLTGPIAPKYIARLPD